MVNCSYCNKEIKRRIFCNASHKVMFHRNGNKQIKVINGVPTIDGKIPHYINTIPSDYAIKQDIQKLKEDIIIERNRCEGFGCKSIQTTLIKGEGYDNEGNLRTYEKWFCIFHKGKR